MYFAYMLYDMHCMATLYGVHYLDIRGYVVDMSPPRIPTRSLHVDALRSGRITHQLCNEALHNRLVTFCSLE